MKALREHLCSTKIKEQTRKCSKHSLEVVDKIDEVSSKNGFEVVDKTNLTCFEECKKISVN